MVSPPRVTEFRGAEKDGERTALKTWMGARPFPDLLRSSLIHTKWKRTIKIEGMVFDDYHFCAIDRNSTRVIFLQYIPIILGG